MNRKIGYITLFAFLAVGCQREDNKEEYGEPVRFDVGIDNTIQTKCLSRDEVSFTIPTSDNCVSLDYFATEGFMGLDGLPQTKGTQYNTSNSSMPFYTYAESLTSFKVTGFNGDGTNFFTTQDAYTDGIIWGTLQDYYWRTPDTKSFYCYTNLPSSGASVSSYAGSQTLTVNSIQPSSAKQTDILLGCYKSANSEIKSNIPITFQHPMTAVVFKVGNVEGTFNVKNITLSGVYLKGTAVQSGNDLNDISWTAEGSTDVTGTTEDPFLLIPQNLATRNVTATIVFNNGTADVTIKALLNTENWGKGVTNIYTINYAVPELSVVVAFNETDKTDIYNPAIKKKGVKAWVRAAVVSSQYKIEGSTEYVYSSILLPGSSLTGFNSTDWTEGTDGFFYYNVPVEAPKDANGVITGKETSLNPLFTRYTFPTGTGLKCHVVVTAQAVQYTGQANCQAAFNN